MNQHAIVPDLPAPFTAFRRALHPQGALRDAITRHMRAPEAECVEALLGPATLTPGEEARAAALATRLVEALRSEGRGKRPGLVDGLLREYDLGSPEGLALMCLAEALLRIPDAAHARRSSSATRSRPATGWRGLMLRAEPVAVRQRRHLGPRRDGAAHHDGLLRVEPRQARSPASSGAAASRSIRQGHVDLAMRDAWAEQFVTGQTIARGAVEQPQGG